MNKMTDWFSPHIKPARIGVYEIKFTSMNLNDSDYPWYATWNGLRWSSASYKKNDDFHKQFSSSIQEKYWRGFTEKQA